MSATTPELAPAGQRARVTLESYQRDFLATRGPWAVRKGAAALRSTGKFEGGDHSETEKAEAKRRALGYLGWTGGSGGTGG